MTLIANLTCNTRIEVDLGDFGAFCEEYQDVYDRFAIKPENGLAQEQNRLVNNLVTNSIWDKFDSFYIVGNNEDNSALNWVKDDHNLTPMLSTSFVSNQGFVGNSADSSYMAMDWNPFVDGVTYTNNEAHISAYVNTNESEDHTFIIGNSSGGSLANPATGIIWRTRSWQGKVNEGTGGYTEFVTTGRNAGFVCLVRTDNTTQKAYFNGHLQDTDGALANGTNLLNGQFQVFRNAWNGLNQSDNGMGMISLGGELSDSEVLILYNAVENYMEYVGADEGWGDEILADFDFETDDIVGRGEWFTVAGAPDYHNNISPVSGSYSLYMPTNAECYLSFPVYSDSIQVKFLIKFIDATPAVNSDFIFLRNNLTNLLYLRLYTTGRIYLSSGGQTDYGATVLTDNTVYYCWLEYTLGSGVDQTAKLYINTTDTKPGTAEVEISGGSGTIMCDRLRLYSTANISYYLDDLYITNND